MVKKHPKIGVGVIVKKENKILAGQRKNAHGDGTWSVPGGHLEFSEQIIECAKREVFEETNIKIKNPKIYKITNDIFKKEKKHYVTIWVKADYESGEININEPDKFIQIKWIEQKEFPKPRFLPLENLIKQGDFK
ncbi:MAG: nucleotide triphosphate diphosphatase NUDT15 [Candidatus Woesearchaeota archaeon]